jgi:putative transposase
VLGFAVGDSEDGAFWTAFLRSLKARGLAGTQLVISDAHTGLKSAIAAVLLGASWQRCRVHFSALRARPGAQGQRRDGRRRDPHDLRPARRRTRALPARRHRRHARPPIPQVEAVLRDAAEDLLAFTAFPVAHWKRIWATNPLERLKKEIKRRTDVVGVFPNPEALLRLAGAVLVEAHDEWQVSDRRYLAEGSMAVLNRPENPTREVAQPALIAS